MLVGAVLFISCSDKDDESTSSLSGMWAYTSDIRNGQETSTGVTEIYEISGNKITYQMFIGSDKEIPKFSDGYLVGYKKSNFEIMGPFNISIRDSHLSIGGLMDMEFQTVSADKLLLWEDATPNEKIVWQRVKEIK